MPESWHTTCEFLLLARDLASYTCEVVLHDLSLGMLLVSSCCLPEACHVTCGNVL